MCGAIHFGEAAVRVQTLHNVCFGRHSGKPEFTPRLPEVPVFMAG